MGGSISTLEKLHIELLRKCGVQTTVQAINMCRKDVESFEKEVFDSIPAKPTFEGIRSVYKDVVAKYDLPSFMIFDRLAKLFGAEIETVFRSDGDKLPPVLNVVLPLGTMNAHAITVDDGALLIMNEGLFFFAERILRLMSYDADFAKLLPPEYRQNLYSKIETRQRQILPRNEIAVFVAGLVKTLITRGNLYESQVPPQQDSLFAGMIKSSYLMAIEMFALAHEYSHLYLGHLDRANDIPVSTPLGIIDIVFNNWDEEIMADATGGNLLSGVYNMHMRTSDGIQPINIGPYVINPGFAWFVFNAAPIFFFSIEGLYRAIGNQLINEQDNILKLETHPPAELRKRVLIKNRIDLFEKTTGKVFKDLSSDNEADWSEKYRWYSAAFFDPIEWCLAWFEEIEELALQIIT